jgi:hypothetical protein
MATDSSLRVHQSRTAEDRSVRLALANAHITLVGLERLDGRIAVARC